MTWHNILDKISSPNIFLKCIFIFFYFEIIFGEHTNNATHTRRIRKSEEITKKYYNNKS